MSNSKFIQRLTLSGLLIAIGVVLGPIVSIPVGVAKIYPIQHMINVLSAVLLGPGYAVANAFLISLLRNLFGVGTLLAFPGSMIGALLASLLYGKFKNIYAAGLGELIGTGIIGALSAYPIAVLLLGSKAAAYSFIIPFAASSFGGVIISMVIFHVPVIQHEIQMRKESNHA